MVRQELARAEGGASAGAVNQSGRGDVGIDNLGLLRDLKYNEALYEQVAKQYELAKLDEAKDPTLLQILDKAIVPDKKSKPQRMIITISAIFIGLLVGIALAFIIEAIRRIKSNEAGALKMQLMGRYLLGK